MKSAHFPQIEPLEARIAPATLIDPRTIIFKDVDGDAVTVKFSRDVFIGTPAAQIALAAQVLTFNTGSVDATAPATPAAQQLRLVDLTKFPSSASAGSSANGLGFTISTEQQGSGDGLADVGAIKAAGVSVGTVVIDGDLGKIVAGGSGLRIGIASLTVDSLGVRGTGTQIPVPTPTTTDPAPNLTSTVTGEATAFTVLHDVLNAVVKVVDGKNGDTVTTAANLGKLTVGGRIYSTASADDSGSIESGRGIGTASIGNIFGGNGKNSGRLSALQGGIKSLTITGNLTGGLVAGAGQVFSFGTIGALTIGSDLLGGAGESSGFVTTFGSITSLTIGGDIVAGTGASSGGISALGSIGKALVKGDIDAAHTANAGARSAKIYAGAGLPAVTVEGNILGGVGLQSGVIESGRTIGKLLIVKSIVGGNADGSGSVLASGAITSATVKLDLTGGFGRQSGTIVSGIDPLFAGDIGGVVIAGKLTGGLGIGSGSIISGGGIKAATIGTLPLIKGAALSTVLNGGQGNGSGSITASGPVTALKINGNILGGAGNDSGSVIVSDRVKGFQQIAGSVGTATIAGSLGGGDGSRAGSLVVDGALKALTVGGIAGGKGARTGSIRVGEGAVAAGDVGSIKVLGDFTRHATPGLDSALIFTTGKLGTLAVSGDLNGATVRVGANAGTITLTGDVTSTALTALGQTKQGATTDVAIAKLSFGGEVTGSTFRAGYDLSGAAANPDAQIGTVTVAGNWSASSLVAGVDVGSDAGYGNAGDVIAPGVDNAKIVSRIASIVIKGSVAGSGQAGSQFGFVAELVRAMKVGTTVYALDALANGQTIAVGAPADGVAIHEVAVPPMVA